MCSVSVPDTQLRRDGLRRDGGQEGGGSAAVRIRARLVLETDISTVS